MKRINVGRRARALWRMAARRPRMGRLDWMQVGGVLSMSSIVVGLGCAFLIKGMEPAAFVGTLPGIAYVIACSFHDWSREI